MANISKSKKRDAPIANLEDTVAQAIATGLQLLVIKPGVSVCTGAKYDSGKARMDLIEPEFEMAMALVLTGGAAVHGADSWKTVEDAVRRYTAALQRHTNAMRKGEIYDTDTKLSHASHIAVNAMFLHYFQTL